MFFAGSRYFSLGVRVVALRDESTVEVTNLPLLTGAKAIGWHRPLDGERLDLLAFRYLGNPTAAWTIAATNNAMDPDALTVHDLIAIPGKAG